MPEPRQPNSADSASYEPLDPAESTPRSRRSRLQRALQSTTELEAEQSRSVEAYANPGRRRARSPSGYEDARADGSESSTYDDGRRGRVKRRMVHFAPSVVTKCAIRYGYFGQVEPGRLHFDLVSCDGGVHRDSRYPTVSLAASNILKHDKSVYVSKQPESNIILQHADDTPFCLERLHIIGPEHGFTAPVRAGIVHVSMNMHDLKRYIDPPFHARRSASNPLSRADADAHRPRIVQSPERLSLTEAFQDEEIDLELQRRRILRTGGVSEYGRGLAAREESPTAARRPTGPEVIGMNIGHADPLIADVHESRTSLADDDPGVEEESSPAVVDFRNQRLRVMQRRYEIETWDRSDERWNGFATTRAEEAQSVDRRPYSSRLDAFMAQSGYYDTFQPSLHRPATPLTNPTTSHTSDVPSDDVVSARFNITHGHKVTIRFQPPVSGRFIMLKLWANKSNVDVQSVLAEGYGGPRFFPARCLR